MKYTFEKKSEKVETDKGFLIVHEMSCGQREKYLDQLQKNMKKGEDGSTTLRSLEGMTSNLLALTVTDENNRPYKGTEIQEWPTTLTLHLTNLSNKLNGLDEEAVESSKNDSQVNA